MYKKLLTFLCAVLFGINLFATEEVVIGSGISGSSDVPFDIEKKHSISQQLYLASNLSSITLSNMSAIKLRCKSSTNAITRALEIWVGETTNTSISGTYFWSVSGSNKTAGTKVFDGDVTLPASAGWYQIDFDTPFEWGRIKNIVVTIIDKSNTAAGESKQHYIFSASGRCAYANKTSGDAYNGADTYNIRIGSVSSNAPQITFIFSEAGSAPSTPSDLAVSATTMNSATLAWSAVAGATSYDLQQSADGSSWTTLASGETGTSFDWTGLSVASTQYARIRATNASGSSDWSGAVTVTTDDVHTHNGITFDKWNSTNSMPLSGSYYLPSDVTISAVGPQELSGDLNLCLNGHTLAFTTASGCIQIGTGETLAIYDAEGSGLITSPHGTATVQVASEGTLAIHGGMIENTAGEKAIKAVAGLDAAHISIDVFDTKDNSAYFNLVSSSGGLIKDPVDGSLDLQVHTNRAFTSSQYNTICVPFPITSAQMSSIFGGGYDLQEFDHSEFDGEELNLYFTQRTDLAAGKPYLLKPSHDVADMTHPWSNIEVSAPVDNTSDTYISFHGVFAPTTLTQNDKNLLFLGADNELFWPNTTNPLKGFRAYFEVKGGARKAVRARIVKGEESTQALDNTVAPNAVQKRIINGQLFIEKNGTLYNAQGQIVK